MRIQKLFMFLTILLMVPSGTVHADQRLSLTRTRDVISSEEPDAKTTSEEFSVVLGNGYCRLDMGEYRRIYDFKKERIYTLHLASKTYLDDSLHSLVSYREVEMRSRLGAGPFEKIENLAVGPDGQFELANLFGMKIEGMNVPDPAEDVQGGVHRFTYEGGLVAEYELRGDALPEDLRDSFRRFLAYECSMHPFIREKLCASGKLFSRMRLTARMGEAVRVTKIVLEQADLVPSAPELVPADFRIGPEPENNDPVLEIICSVLNGTAKVPEITSEDLRKMIGDALQEKQYAQAMVYYLHNMLQFGCEDIDLLGRISNAAGNDEGFLLINIGVRSNTKAEAERALIALDAIDRSQLKSAYVLDVYKADALSTAGRVSESKRLLVGVIRTNPYLAGAYKDLGGILFAAYDMPGAWRCWELCLKLCPGYSLLSKFDWYQEQRRKRHPDFF